MIASLDPRTDPRWLRLASGPTGSLFTSPPWIQAVCESYGFTPEARIALSDSGEPLDGFAWVPIDDIRGARASALPFSDRGDPLVSNAAAWPGLAADALSSGLPLTLRCLSDSAAVADPRLHTVGEAAWHATPTDCTESELLARISSASRRNIKAADRNGVTVSVSSELDAVHSFHRLHVWLRKNKYGLLAQPVEFFERIWQRFAPDDGVVTMLAELDGETVAGAVFLVWRDTLYYKFGASLAEYLPKRPNDAIYWAGLRLAVERGLRGVDWGLSDLDQPGLVSYKRKWGSVEGRIVTLRGGPDPVPKTEVGAMLTELTRLFTDESVPDEITTRAGALLYRNFS